MNIEANIRAETETATAILRQWITQWRNVRFWVHIIPKHRNRLMHWILMVTEIYLLPITLKSKDIISKRIISRRKHMIYEIAERV